MLYELEKARAWEREQAAYDKLLKLRRQSATIVFNIESYDVVFHAHPKIIQCIDERIALGAPAIGLAGSGILLSDAELKKVVTRLKSAGVDQVTYHEGCGACALWCNEHENTTGDHVETIDAAIASAQKLQSLLQPKHKLQRAGYSALSHHPMTGHPHFHHARAAVIDFTGTFDSRVLDLPAVFLISAAYHPSINYTRKEIDIAISIALGDHGFGKKRFLQQPFVLLVVGTMPQQLASYANQPGLALIHLKP